MYKSNRSVKVKSRVASEAVLLGPNLSRLDASLGPGHAGRRHPVGHFKSWSLSGPTRPIVL